MTAIKQQGKQHKYAPSAIQRCATNTTVTIKWESDAESSKTDHSSKMSIFLGISENGLTIYTFFLICEQNTMTPFHLLMKIKI